jgi:F0F1-type ATP synthase membrane subunit b/b'
MSDVQDTSHHALRLQIAVAVIGLVGSLGGAWIASGTKFERELESRGEQIKALETSLTDARKKLDEQQAKLEKVTAEIETAKKAVGQIAAKAGDLVWGRVKGAWSLGGAKEEPPK